jgi:hypothetical protein
MAAMLHPASLRDTVDIFVEYINGFNAKSILKDPLPKVTPCDAKPPAELNMSTKIPGAFDMETLTASIALEKINELLRHEMTVAEYIYSIEVYHTKIIATMNDIQKICGAYVK